MAKKAKTTAEFIAEAQAVHGDTFDYSEVVYKSTNTPVTIICEKHGRFQQTPKSHLNGSGCSRCNGVTCVEDALVRFNEVHGNKYDYSRFTKWVGSQGKIPIGCSLHGEFTQSVAEHLKGSGCPECGNLKKSKANQAPVDHYIEKARIVHGNRYDYSMWEDGITWHQMVKIICPTHGVFEQLLGSHIKGSGCGQCSRDVAGVAATNSKAANISAAQRIFGDVLDYMKVPDVVNNHTPITLRCKIHNIEFETTWNQHLSSGVGCPTCSRERKQGAELDQYGVKHHKQRHLGAAAVQQLDDLNMLVERNHVHGHSLPQIAQDIGCDPTTIHKRFVAAGIEVKVGYHSSGGEIELRRYIEQLAPVDTNTRKVIGPRELDIYVPSHNLAIEYCGLYWHSDRFKDRNYHLDKLERCQEKNVRLITIFEDEWSNTPSIVKDKLAEILGKSSKPTVFARKCTVRSLTHNEKKSFFNVNHIQGSGPGSVTYGLQQDGQIVAAMTFIRQPNQRWDLNRYATSCNVPGGFSKLLAHFKRNHEWTEIVSFADRRWSEGNVYERNGFELEGILPPDYYYAYGGERFHKFNFRHKNLPKLLGDLYDPNETEFQNMDRSKYLRIWNCGLLRYVQRNAKKPTD